MPRIRLEALEARRRHVEGDIARRVEIDINAALAGQPIVHSITVTRLGQDLNILTAAIERVRNAA